ncbi:MAG: dihydrolipoyl dehydrogenase [Thermogutta sp.]|nr:dihydrolipoyl dehydrogenase [Thermogutta sp.]HPU06217.1 dihydrolipoyl dehydrogenase [Thermogutta sp.]HQF13668.1 dihydrolipoyl dehydrogenase [Thermogutta sp.]
MDIELVVIGGGPGGYAAAFLAADLGMKVAIVDQEPRLGGVCLLRGCIPSKALLHVTRVIAETEELKEWGVDYSKPAVELNKLRARKEKVISILTGGLKQLAAKRNVRVIHARAQFRDGQTLRLSPVNGGTLEDNVLRFQRCIIATGSRPVIPGLFPTGVDRIMDSTVALDLPEIPDSLLVVGGGYIGLEMGMVYASLGSRVTVVEMMDGLLPGVDRDLVRPLQKRLEGLFAAIYLNTKVAAVHLVDNGVEATFEGAKTGTERFSRVLVSVGRRPNSDNLGLENTKVQVDSQGFIVVDARRRTAEPAVYAIGDVAGQPMLAHKAAHEGKTAVEAISGHKVAFEPRAIPAVVFTDPEIAWTGLTETDAKRKGIPYEVAVFPWAASGRAQAMGRTDGFTKWIIDPKTERVMGCGIVGPSAGDLIGEATLAVEMAASARDLAETIHPHPTLCETLGFAAEVFFGQATDLYRPRKKD